MNVPVRTAAAMAGLGLALSLSACSSSESVSDANAEYCEGAAAIQEEFTKLEALIESGAPREAIEEQRDFTEAAIEANRVPEAQLQSSVKSEIEAANDAFNEAVDAIPDDAAPAEVAAAYKAAIDTREAAISEVESELGCE